MADDDDSTRCIQRRLRRRLPLIPTHPPTLPAPAPAPASLPTGRRNGPGRACCRCNRFGTCKGCSCVKEGKLCTSCPPGRLERCCNLSHPPPPSASLPAGGFSQHDTPPTTTLSNALPSLDSILSVRTPTLHHVPKGVRDMWATAFCEALTSLAADPHQTDAWCKLFMLPRCLLSSPPRGGRSHWRDTLKTVRTRIQKWRAGNFVELWEEVASANHSLKARLSRSSSSGSSPDAVLRSNVIRARRAVGDGQYRKALQSLSSAGLAQPSADVLVEMLAKHPPSANPALPEDTPPPPVQFSSEEVIKALKSFPAGSAPGPSGLRANHIKQAVLCPSPDRAGQALTSLTRFVNLLCSGNVPSEIVPHLCGATLLPCKKKSGGLRPIAVGEVLRRLTSKCTARAVIFDAVDTLAPLQLGVGVPSGCEAIIHSLSNIMEDPNVPPDHRFVLLVDFSNAFNSVDRSTLFQEVRHHTPSISSWVECCYGARPILRLGDHTILSSSGVQQGDPLGPLGFALVLHPIIERIKREVPDLLLNAWYLDDGTLCGSLDSLAAALSIIESEGLCRGLSLNRSKSLIAAPPNLPVLHPALSDIPVTSNGFTLLGSPLGPAAYCLEAAQQRISKVRQSLLRLGDLQDSQMEAALLRSCLSLPKIAHLLRTCPLPLIEEALMGFDDALRDALSALAGCPLTDWAWRKASLPSSMGGLGVRAATLYAPAAFIGSFHQSKALISDILGHPARTPLLLPSVVGALASAADRPTWLSIDSIDSPLVCHTLSRAIDEANFSLLLQTVPDVRSKALALSSSIPHAGDWLNVVPSVALGLHLSDQEFRLCLRYWLGLRMFPDGACPVCHSATDPFGDHHVGCGGNSDRILRHNSLRDAIFTAAQTAALAPRRELPSLIPGSMSRPADVYLPSWERGRPAALDVTVISTMQSATIQGASTIQGHSLQVGEARKLAAHANACNDVGVSFIPIVFETLGGISSSAANTLASLGRLIGQRLGNPPADSIRHLFQRCAILLWRGNATLWIRRLPTLAPSVDGIP